MAKARKSASVSRSALKCAVIGLGMGRHHAKSFAADARAELAAVCDLSAERCLKLVESEKWPGVRCYADYREMLKAEKPEVVAVALPNCLHAQVATDCLRAGAHVLCEKPMAMNVGECRGMLRAAAKARRKLMINFSYRYTPATRFLKRIVDEGRLGRVYYARTGWHRRRGIPGIGGWFTTKKMSGGGPLIDLGVHRIDLAWWLMGCPEPVAVSGSTYAVFGPKLARARGKSYTVEDLAAGIVRFAGGQTLLVEVSWACNMPEGERMFTELYGDKGGARQVNVDEGYRFKTEYYTEMAGSQVDVVTHGGGSEHVEGGVSHLLTCIEKGREPESPGEHGLAIQRILDGMYRSAALGREVAV